MISDYVLQKIAELHALGRSPKQILGALHKDRAVSGQHDVMVELNVKMIERLLPKDVKPQVDDKVRARFPKHLTRRK